jgi:hypothetical protein
VKPVLAKPKVYLSGGRWRFVPAVNWSTARERNNAALRFIHRRNRTEGRGGNS